MATDSAESIKVVEDSMVKDSIKTLLQELHLSIKGSKARLMARLQLAYLNKDCPLQETAIVHYFTKRFNKADLQKECWGLGLDNSGSIARLRCRLAEAVGSLSGANNDANIVMVQPGPAKTNINQTNVNRDLDVSAWAASVESFPGTALEQIPHQFDPLADILRTAMAHSNKHDRLTLEKAALDGTAKFLATW